MSYKCTSPLVAIASTSSPYDLFWMGNSRRSHEISCVVNDSSISFYTRSQVLLLLLANLVLECFFQWILITTYWNQWEFFSLTHKGCGTVVFGLLGFYVSSLLCLTFSDLARVLCWLMQGFPGMNLPCNLRVLSEACDFVLKSHWLS